MKRRVATPALVAFVIATLPTACAGAPTTAQRANPVAATPDSGAPTSSPAVISSAAPGKQAATAQGSFECHVSIDWLGTRYDGRAEGKGLSATDDDKVRATAAACQAMEKAEQVSCRDVERYVKAEINFRMSDSGKPRHVLRTRLRPILTTRTASARGEIGWRESCLEAVRLACEERPPDSICEAGRVSCSVPPNAPARCDPIRSSDLGLTENRQYLAEPVIEIY